MSKLELTLVTIENCHQLIPQYIAENEIKIESYDDMTNVILSMIKGKHFFNMDKNILRGCLEDLTYMYCPEDDVNKDRVMAMLELSDDEDDDDDDDMEVTDFLPDMEQFQKMLATVNTDEK
tara:strand:+ start:36 stop:398 length:363 start_codon:yes stop_codon:yes gene_type:complete